jgi:translocation and assembly module TamA
VEVSGTDDDACDGDKIFVGGDLMALASFELRFRLPYDFGLAAFVDAAEIWATEENFDFKDVNVAVGPGLRYYTAFGPIRLDFALLVTRPKTPGFAFHLSIGQAF